MPGMLRRSESTHTRRLLALLLFCLPTLITPLRNPGNGPRRHRQLSVWAAPPNNDTTVVAVVDSNAPVLRWQTSVDSQGTFSYNVTVSTITPHDDRAVPPPPIWSSGEVVQGNWPADSPPFPGLAVYEGPALTPGQTYTFHVTERQFADGAGANVSSRSWSAGTGTFQAAADLAGAREELVAELRSPNMTLLWNTSERSIWQRVEPSGFLPTSVSNGYGGITSLFVRDAAGMIVGMLELGPDRWATARKAMRFLLHGLQCTQNPTTVPGCSIGNGMRRPPEVLVGDCPDAARAAGSCKYNTKIVGVSANEETDGAFYVIAGWGRVVAITGDASLERDFYATLKTYMAYYFTPGAASAGGVPYWNETLGLLWTPMLEHSRLTRGWSAYDSLTNSFAIEAIRYMIQAAERQEPASPARAAMVQSWAAYREKIVASLDTGALSYAGVETGEAKIYAELLGHVNGYPGLPVGNTDMPRLFGMSWVQLAVLNCLLSNLSSAGGDAPLVPAEGLGISPATLDNTFRTYATSGSFLWQNADIERSALVQTTNVNASRLRSPPYRPAGPPPPPPAHRTCATALHGKDALQLASGADTAKLTNVTGAAQCCAECDAAGLARCRTWFFRGDTGECFFKLAAARDPVTAPEPFFAAGHSIHDNGTASPWCPTVSWPFGGSCPPGCPCPARVVIGKGLGWEIGWAAHRQRWTRLIALHRWLGAAHHVEREALFGEDMDYDCIKALERGAAAVPPSNGRCWGDAGNGVQIGWFVWGEAFMRRKLGVLL